MQKHIAAAMEKGVETAYKAVMKPKEGTILTVAREAAAKAVELAETAEDLDTFFQAVIAHAEETLAKTPEMLPVLKEAGVVDSGGQGLLEVYQGAYDGFLGKEIDYTQFEAQATGSGSYQDRRHRRKQILSLAIVQSLLFYLDKPIALKKQSMSLRNSWMSHGRFHCTGC